MFESCICIDVDDPCILLNRQRPRARKQHKCIECRQLIQPGEIYERDTTIFEGDISVYKTCLICVCIRSELLICGWHYGDMWNDIHEAHCEDEDDECICPT